jgi:hypothetical protein
VVERFGDGKDVSCPILGQVRGARIRSAAHRRVRPTTGAVVYVLSYISIRIGEPQQIAVTVVFKRGRSISSCGARQSSKRIVLRHGLVVVAGVLASNGIAISMDGKGAWRDNVFVERLWRSVKYEEVAIGRGDL